MGTRLNMRLIVKGKEVSRAVEAFLGSERQIAERGEGREVHESCACSGSVVRCFYPRSEHAIMIAVATTVFENTANASILYTVADHGVQLMIALAV